MDWPPSGATVGNGAGNRELTSASENPVRVALGAARPETGFSEVCESHGSEQLAGIRQQVRRPRLFHRLGAVVNWEAPPALRQPIDRSTVPIVDRNAKIGNNWGTTGHEYGAKIRLQRGCKGKTHQ